MTSPRSVLKLLIIVAVVLAAVDGARKKTRGKQGRKEEAAEPEGFDEPSDGHDTYSPENDDKDGYTSVEEEEEEERQGQGQQGVKCDASRIPAAEIYLMSEYVEDFFEGHSSTDEVHSKLRSIHIRDAPKPCREAFNSLKNLTVSVLDGEEDTDAMLVYKSLIRILNQRLRELFELQKQVNLTKATLSESPAEETILLVKYEIASGDVDNAAEHFQQLFRVGITVTDIIDRVYEIQYLENILLFLETIPVDNLLEGCLRLYDYLINDESLDNVAAALFDEYLERFSSLKAATAIIFIFNGMRYKLQERMELLDVQHQDRASLIAVEIKKGDLVAAMEKFFEYSQPSITEIVRYSVLGNSMSSLTEFLDEFQDADKIQASLAVMKLMDSHENSENRSDETAFYEFLLRSVENSGNIAAQLLFEGMIRRLIAKFPHLEVMSVPTPVTPRTTGAIIMIQPKPGNIRTDVHQNYFSQYESSKATNYFEQHSTGHKTSCFYFDGQGSHLIGRPMMPLSPTAKWHMSLEFKAVKKNGLLMAVENDPYNFGIFLRDGRVCVAHPALMCTSELHKFDDNLWHVITVKYHGNGLLEIDVDRAGLNSGLPSLADRSSNGLQEAEIDRNTFNSPQPTLPGAKTVPKRRYVVKSLRKLPIGSRRLADLPRNSTRGDRIYRKKSGILSRIKNFQKSLPSNKSQQTPSKAKKESKNSSHGSGKSSLISRDSKDLEEIVRRIYNSDNIRKTADSTGQKIKRDGTVQKNKRANEILNRLKQKARLGERSDFPNARQRFKRDQGLGVEEPRKNSSRRMMEFPKDFQAQSKAVEVEESQVPEFAPRIDGVQNNIYVGSIPLHRKDDFYGLEEVESFQGEIRAIKANLAPILVSKHEGTSQCLQVGRSKPFRSV